MINIEKQALLAKLHENRAAHVDKVTRARAAYHDRVIAELEDRLAAAKRGNDIDPGFLHLLPIPRDYTLEYDRAIDQYEWEVKDTVELSREEFNRYVRDEWQWNDQFIATSEIYLAE